ncbi:MAG: dienelactone hydrolase family protein [Desulfococcaceae bacterium]
MKIISSVAIGLVLMLGISPAALAEIRAETVPYKHGDATLQGYLAYDDAQTGKRPGVLVIHEWWGLNDYAKSRARQLAELGYVAFAADMYGDGVTTADPKQAGEWSNKIKNGPLIRERSNLALDALRNHERVDPDRIAAIGYCFGGTTVLELAYSGADIAGVVPFHGGLTIPKDEDAIRTKLLVLHGAADFFIEPKTIDKFQKELEEREADWQMIYHGGAVHAFTNPDADKAGIDGVAYDADADRRSWAQMRLFFDEIFAE